MAFADYKEAASKLRDFLKDHADLNTLDEMRENTDDDLIDAIKDTLNEINLDYQPITYWKLSDVVVEPGIDQGWLSWSTVKLGAVLHLLTSNGILNARNYLTYSDAGGIQVTDRDKWGRYINYFNVLVNKYVAGVRTAKIRINIEAGYGGVASPLSFDVY